MAEYKVYYKEEVYMVGYLEAESEEEAQELAEMGAFLDTKEVDSGGIDIEEIEEM